MRLQSMEPDGEQSNRQENDDIDDVPIVYKLRVSVNRLLTVFSLTPVGRYSSEIQQPAHAMAILGSRPHPCQTASFGREQGRVSSLHPEGQCSVNETWTEHEVCSRSSQLSTSPTYGLRSREAPRRRPVIRVRTRRTGCVPGRPRQRRVSPGP
jgi:hypothetical protein